MTNFELPKGSIQTNELKQPPKDAFQPIRSGVYAPFHHIVRLPDGTTKSIAAKIQIERGISNPGSPIVTKTDTKITAIDEQNANNTYAEVTGALTQNPDKSFTLGTTWLSNENRKEAPGIVGSLLRTLVERNMISVVHTTGKLTPNSQEMALRLEEAAREPNAQFSVLIQRDDQGNVAGFILQHKQTQDKKE